MKQETIYTLEDKDIDTIKTCLNYCYHRGYKHNKKQAGDLKEIDRLRNEFSIVKDRESNDIEQRMFNINNKTIEEDKHKSIDDYKKELEDELESFDSLEDLWDTINSIFKK